MGGYGSGRSGGGPIADECHRVELGRMLRIGQAKDGAYISGTLSWTVGGRPSGCIGYQCDMINPDDAWLWLNFTKTPHNGEPEKVEQKIRLTYTRPNYGGRRWWMLCPYTGKRVDVLYMPNGTRRFASRKAWRVQYQSQRDAPRDRPFSKLYKLQRRLGCEVGWGGFIRRPKGMWHSTFDRHLERFYELDHQCNREMMAVIGLLNGQLRCHDKSKP